MLRIGCGECFGEPRLLFGIPLYLIAIKSSIAVFDIIDFLLLPGAPEIGICVELMILQELLAFTENKIFPQSANVISQVNRMEI